MQPTNYNATVCTVVIVKKYLMLRYVMLCYILVLLVYK